MKVPSAEGVAQAIERVREQLRAHVDEKFRIGAARFFKDEVRLYGVRSSSLRGIESEVYKTVKAWPAADRLRFFEELFRSGMLEEGAVACHVARRFSKAYGRAEFAVFERWIDEYTGNWATCDGISSWLLAACIANEPALTARLRAWTRSKNRWKRRAVAVSLLQEAKAGRNTEAILGIAAAVLEDEDDMVRKGVGWLLKEAYPRAPSAIVSFLRKDGGAPRLVLRIAAEKMTPADRALVLGRH